MFLIKKKGLKLNYLYTGLAKSLLLFSKGSQVHKLDKTYINFIKIYGANYIYIYI